MMHSPLVFQEASVQNMFDLIRNPFPSQSKQFLVDKI